MPTKAELEAELADLRKQIEAGAADKRSSDKSEASAEAKTDAAMLENPIDWAKAHLDGAEVEKLFKQFAAELEGMHEHKPLLTIFGAFLLGYVLGRGR